MEERSKHDKQKVDFDCKRKSIFRYLDSYCEKNRIDAEKGMEVFARIKGESKRVQIKSIQAVNIVFDADKLEEKLPKSLSQKVLKRKIILDDIRGFIEYAKSLGATPEEIRKFVVIEREVNKEQLERLYDTGSITDLQLDGCYTTKKSSQYYKITESEINEKGKDD